MTDPTVTVAALAALPYGVVLFDRQGRLSLLNPAATRILAADADACLGLTATAFADAFGLPATIGPERQWARSADARYLVQALPIPVGVDGADLSLGLLLTEPTQELHLIELLSDTFAFAMRPPLTSVSSVAFMLQRGLLASWPEEVPRVLEILAHNARKLQRVIAQCFWLTRHYLPAHALSFDEIELGPWLQDELAQAQRSYAHAGLSWSLELPDQPLMAHVAPDLLRQTLDELIDNACCFTPSGGAITLRAWNEPSGIVVSVSDTGAGIDSADQEQLRRTLGSTEDPIVWRRARGRGLLIAQRCGARGHFTLSFESVQGAGTTFRVHLAHKVLP